MVELLFYARRKYFEPALYNDTYEGKRVCATGDKFYVDGIGLFKDIHSAEDVPLNTQVCFIILKRREEQIVLSNGEKVNPAPIIVCLLTWLHILTWSESMLSIGLHLPAACTRGKYAPSSSKISQPHWPIPPKFFFWQEIGQLSKLCTIRLEKQICKSYIAP